jgi:hypothetical protein
MPPITLGRQRSSLRFIDGGVDAGPGRRLTRGPRRCRPRLDSTRGRVCGGDARGRSWLDHVGVYVEAWLNRDDQFVAGQEIFRSEREFTVWAFTVSHGQLLLRAGPIDGQPRIDILFKPVEAMKLRAGYAGLVVRCATVAEHERVLASTGLAGQALRVLVIETATEFDYVVAGAVGWREDGGRDNDPSSLAFFPPGSDPNRILAPDASQAGEP